MSKYPSEIADIDDHKEFFVCSGLAQLKKPAEIRDEFQKKFKRKLSLQNITYYRKTKGDIIEKLREKFLLGTLEIPISQERVRLERAEELYEISQKITDKKDRVLTGLHCIRDAREEVKGSTSGNNYLQFNQYNDFTDEQLLDTKKKLEKRIIEISKKESVCPNPVP